MKRIVVTAEGKAKASPDTIRLSLHLNARNKDHAETMAEIDTKIAAVTNGCLSCGLTKEQVQTDSYQLDQDYEDVPDKSGKYRRKLVGYRASVHMTMALPMDLKLLSDVLSALAGDGTPEINVEFTVCDTERLKRTALKDCAEKARGEAEALCEASKVKLGSLVEIVYGSDTPGLETSRMRMPLMKMAAMDSITPSDVEINEEATFTFDLL